MVIWKQTSKLVKAAFATATSGKFSADRTVRRTRHSLSDLRFALAEGLAAGL
jgi:hypothetical protein